MTVLADNVGLVPSKVPVTALSNANAGSAISQAGWVEPCVASIYQLDGLVRRAPSLQSTADAKAADTQEVQA